MEKLKTISIKTPIFCRAAICFIKDIFILFPGGASLDADHPDIKTKKRAGVKGKAPYMRSALKETTQRYKSLMGFAIYAIACDISSMRYALRDVKGIYIISQPTAREVISLLSVACMASRENISHLRKQIYRHKKELLCSQKQCLQRKEDEEFYRSSSFSCR